MSSGSAGERAPVVVDLHVDLYPREAVERGLAAFAPIADLALERGERYYRIIVKSTRTVSPERLGAELANYVLASARSAEPTA